MFAALVVSVLLGSAAAVDVGQRCYSTAECTTAKSYCAIISPSCNSGTCDCIPGYIRDTDGSCKRSVDLGGSCRDTDLCGTENAVCNSGTCQCATGYKKGLKGTDCVSTLKTEKYNGKCYDSVQCYYNMVCLNNQCTCYTGYKVVGDYQCQERAVGDACSVDDDCSRTPNTACVGGKCSCQANYRQVEIVTLSGTTALACILGSDSTVGEGKSCNTTVGQSGSMLCGKPYACLSCDASTVGAKCARLTAALAGASSTGPVLATTLLFAVSSFVMRRFSA